MTSKLPGAKHKKVINYFLKQALNLTISATVGWWGVCEGIVGYD
jgi:hypothetical protein